MFLCSLRNDPSSPIDLNPTVSITTTLLGSSYARLYRSYLVVATRPFTSKGTWCGCLCTGCCHMDAALFGIGAGTVMWGGSIAQMHHLEPTENGPGVLLELITASSSSSTSPTRCFLYGEESKKVLALRSMCKDFVYPLIRSNLAETRSIPCRLRDSGTEVSLDRKLDRFSTHVLAASRYGSFYEEPHSSASTYIPVSILFHASYSQALQLCGQSPLLTGNGAYSNWTILSLACFKKIPHSSEPNSSVPVLLLQ